MYQWISNDKNAKHFIYAGDAAQNDSFEKIQAKLSDTLSMLGEYYRSDRLWQKLKYRAFSQKNREAMRISHVQRDAIETV